LPINSFASHDALSLLTLPEHDAVLAGDTITTLSINREWRKIIGAAILDYFENGNDDSLTLDNWDLLNALLFDLYTYEVIGANVLTRTLNIASQQNSTSSTTFLAMPNTTFTHTPSKANMLVTVDGISIINTTANSTIAEIVCNQGTRAENSQALVAGASGREVSAAARFSDMPIGTLCTFNLNWRVTGGTGTRGTSALTVSILEYD